MSNFLKSFIFIITLGTLLFTSCKKEKEEYTITLLSADEHKGTVTGGGTFEEGSKITIQAEALKGYHFSRWDDGNSDNPRTVEVIKNYTYIAQFISDTLRGSIYENTTLRKGESEIDYIIDGELRIEGSACVTIEPGVTIAFTDTTGGIYATDNAALNMEGTAANPILFKGLQEGVQWNAIRYASKRGENCMKHVLLMGGGAKGYIMDLGNSKVSIENCQFNGSSGHGITGNAPTFASFTNNVIRNCSKSPIILSSLKSFQDLSANNEYKNNGVNFLTVNGANLTLFENLTIKKQPIAYYIKGGSLILQGSSSVTIEPGAALNFDSRSQIKVEEQASLFAEGTATEHIVFSAYNPNNKWEGIRFVSVKGSKMSYCDLSHTNNYAITVEGKSNTSLSEIVISDSEYGINITQPDNRHLILKVMGFVFEACRKGNIYYDYWDEIHDEFEESYPISNEFNL